MKTELLSSAPDGVVRAIGFLVRDQLVALPTETVYGLAGNATREEAVLKIFAAKERPSFDPLIVHVSSELLNGPEGPLAELVASGLVAPGVAAWPESSRIVELMQAFWPGPLTLLLPKGPRIPDAVTSGLSSVGIRMPAHPVFQAVLAGIPFPLAAPSANRFGRISPTSARHVEQELSGRIAAIVDGGDCEVGVESTILALAPGGEACVLRPGKVPVPELERILQFAVKTPAGSSRPLAPGMLDQHYAPRKPLYLIPHPLTSREQLEEQRGLSGLAGTPGLLTQKKLSFDPGICVHLRLSEGGSDVEAARNLFSMLRRLDGDDSISHIIADLPPTPRHSLSSAIADRLNRASINKPLLTP